MVRGPLIGSRQCGTKPRTLVENLSQDKNRDGNNRVKTIESLGLLAIILF